MGFWAKAGVCAFPSKSLMPTQLLHTPLVIYINILYISKKTLLVSLCGHKKYGALEYTVVISPSCLCSQLIGDLVYVAPFLRQPCRAHVEFCGMTLLTSQIFTPFFWAGWLAKSFPLLGCCDCLVPEVIRHALGPCFETEALSLPCQHITLAADRPEQIIRCQRANMTRADSREHWYAVTWPKESDLVLSPVFFFFFWYELCEWSTRYQDICVGVKLKRWLACCTLPQSSAS